MNTQTATKNRSIESMIRPGDGKPVKRSKNRYAERLETLRRKKIRSGKIELRSDAPWTE